MSREGLIIRLIDVALIILFGFIAISDIKLKAQIKLPTDAPESEFRGERHLLTLQIDGDGRFQLTDSTAVERIATVNELETQLVRHLDYHRAAGHEMVVLIEPDPESMIQLTVTVMDICEKHGIPKNINYPSLEL